MDWQCGLGAVTLNVWWAKILLRIMELSTGNRYHKSKVHLQSTIMRVPLSSNHLDPIGKSSLFPTLQKENSDTQDSLGESVLPFYPVVPRDPAPVITLGGRVLRPIKKIP